MDVFWTRPALGDLESIMDYIAQESPVAAHKLVSTIMDKADRLLSDNPMIGRRGRVAGTRELVIAQTPYIVAYRITSRIEILAVIHGTREWPESFS